jgi:acetylglutamate kinase
MSVDLHKVTVVKIGGVALGSNDTTLEDIAYLEKQGMLLVVVHGGGKLTTEWLKKHGIETRFVRGERVTDGPSLEVATAVLAGLVNKQVAAGINLAGGKAIGISGVDGGLLQCRIQNPELGYVGQVARVNSNLLQAILGAGYVPVIAPIGLYLEGRLEGAPLLVNINADLAAGELAAAIGAERLIFLTDVAGVCDQSGKLLTQLSVPQAEELVASGVASGGMIPKIKACLRAVNTSYSTCIIDGREPHALRHQLKGRSSGTTIYKG